ncbi:isoprenylcysteine carboxylmethyltransferase family protein [Sphingorhabdus pulchriflava]|uniref:Isoprenylcysteine carboxylmethyltransferase family protein n=1 Tax=Sphingorhabdus pulchriflava TaxID=2292257 RepID=A0A371B2F1_9SPHN|nr:isoprenylcysteine carboxylmethyltransferase family protein [Sphingorhabdus pulchriflava]RDV01748.1 isoprenylcysteine carboxylmethyltransferase family protein [Sphingorhabdus pulchriflava]
MMIGLHSAPFLAMVAFVVATLVRGMAIRRATGDRPWAFASAKGVQRIAGSSFALCVAALLVAAALAPANGTNLAVLAAIVSLAGAAIVIVAQMQMGRAWRVGVREGDAPLFVSHGLFRFSRNPIFVGMMLVGLSAAIVSDTWWSWSALVLFVLSCIVQVRIEEAHLEASFGDAYRAFCRQVPRWLGLARSA